MTAAVTRLADYPTTDRCPATVVSCRRITPPISPEEVRELVLEVGRADFAGALGQHIAIIVPGGQEFGRAEHVRLYTIADLPARGPRQHPRLTICVRRCSYIDAYNGEEYPGIASHYLCDRQAGDTVTLAGPFSSPFTVPEERDATLILIGTGTGIAPFRAFVKHLYRDVPDWHGRVWLFYGARSGLELLYLNDEHDDFAQYYDRETFQAFKALSPRPAWGDPIHWEAALAERGAELWQLLGEAKTWVYVAGLEKTRAELDKALAVIAGGVDKWRRRRAELVAGGRWVELLY